MDAVTPEREIREYMKARSREPECFVSERDIAKRFGLNRSSARKLLLSMEGEGLVQSMPQKGYRLIDYSATAPSTVRRIRDVVKMEAARLACQRAERSDFIRLALILEDAAQKLATGDHAGLAALDEEFDRALILASHDPMLIRLFDFTCIPALRSESADGTPRDNDFATRQALLDALRARDAAAVAAALAERT